MPKKQRRPGEGAATSLARDVAVDTRSASICPVERRWAFLRAGRWA
jgi:hypothetical protein